MSVAGIILSAGQSRRMGFPKALLEFGGETFLDRLIGIFQAHCSPVIVVLGAGAERIQAGLRRSAAATLVENSEWPRGQITSLLRGLQAVPEQSVGVLFTLVDHPSVSAATVARLLPDPEQPPPLIRIPRYQGRRGHPVFLSRELIPQFLALSPEQTARDVLSRHASRIEYLDVADPGILDDVDDPEAYRRLLAGVRP